MSHTKPFCRSPIGHQDPGLFFPLSLSSNCIFPFFSSPTAWFVTHHLLSVALGNQLCSDTMTLWIFMSERSFCDCPKQTIHVYRQIVINEIEREKDSLKSQLIFIHLTAVDRRDFGNKMERTDLCLSAQQNICKSETLSWETSPHHLHSLTSDRQRLCKNKQRQVVCQTPP